jgi:hypothetical protein
MRLRDLFKKPPPILTLAELEDFLDSRAAFVSQKCVFEFSRAAAGYMWQPLFKEPLFLEALERSRWECYPLGLADVAEVTLGTLRPHAEGRLPDLVTGLQTSLDRVMSRYSSPTGLPETFWAEATQRVRTRVARAGAAATRSVKDISILSAQDVQKAMPLHEKIKGRDSEFVRNNFTMSLLRAHEELTALADAPRLAGLLVGAGQLADVTEEGRP